MELWIWLGAVAAALIIFILVLVWSASRAVVLAKKIKPFAAVVASFQANSKKYPEAVKFYKDLASSKETPDKKA